MYIVKFNTYDRDEFLQNEHYKLRDGKVTQGINKIGSCTFELFPSEPGFNDIYEFKTKITVESDKEEFYGRVLKIKKEMTTKGEIYKSVICESALGFLHDSIQDYIEERNWTTRELFEVLINCHNSQVEPEKHFKLGTIEAVDDNDNIFCGIQRETTFKTIEDKFLKKAGGEIRYRREGNELYLDYVKKFGSEKTTSIEVSKNMMKVSEESDPTKCYSCVIPLGAKLLDKDGKETEQRVDVAEINGGNKILENPKMIETIGKKVAKAIFDDVHDKNILKSKGERFLVDNAKTKIKYSVTALDLSLLGIDPDSVDLYNEYPLKNHLLGIDEVARVTKKTIDLTNETKNSFELGDEFKTLSDRQVEESRENETLKTKVSTIEKDYVTNQTVQDLREETSTLIRQTENSINLRVEEQKKATSEIKEEVDKKIASFSGTADGFKVEFEKIKSSVGKHGTYIDNEKKYINFIDGKISLGADGSTMKSVHSNESIHFEKDGVIAATMDLQGTTTRNAAVDNQVSFFKKWAIRRGAKNSKGQNNLNDVWIGGK